MLFVAFPGRGNQTCKLSLRGTCHVNITALTAAHECPLGTSMRSERGVKNATHARAKLGETVWLHMASWPIRIVNLIFQFKSEPEYSKNTRNFDAKELDNINSRVEEGA
jgi:hypothetical protein